MEVADQGVEFNPLTAAPALSTVNSEGLPIGGWGIFLLKALSTSLTSAGLRLEPFDVRYLGGI